MIKRRNGKTIFIILILVLAPIMLNIILISKLKDKPAEQTVMAEDAIYCVSETSPNDKIEQYFDFKDGAVYKYTIITTNPILEGFDKVKQAQFVANLNARSKGFSSKIWFDKDSYTTIETFYLDILTEQEMNSLTALSLTNLKNQSREELRNLIIPISGNDHSCY